MSVKLISVTKSTITVDGRELTPEELIVYVARVSNPANQENLETAPKLLGYLIRNKHWSPLETVSMTVEVNTSRAIAQQIIRHQFKIQEFSQRYAESFDYVNYPARRQDVKNRQNSIDDLPPETQEWFKQAQEEVWETSFGLYKQALEKGIAKESARFLLPLNTATRLYLTNNIRNWVHYLQVRTDPTTQREHRDIAVAIKDQIFTPSFPGISAAMGW